ncbi:helix-turn-helix transcriptional regulator [Ramlibacter sp. AN1133]|uniref:helix-turn-helix transcriptional regulator n=1 Tax=Ramlibacter sp. AN1133 TaxID=3133429 RepID=UPI0030C5D6BE
MARAVRRASDRLDPVSAAVQVEGEVFHICGRVDGAGYAFWIEKPRGELLQHINLPLQLAAGQWPQGDVLAVVGDDPLLRTVALGSGWFGDTGRKQRHGSYAEPLEVWSITARCLELFGPTGEVREAEQPADDALALFSDELSIYLTRWANNHIRFGVRAAIVMGPVPQSHDAKQRALLGSSDPALKRRAAAFIRPAVDPNDADSLVTPLDLVQAKDGWMRAAAEAGYLAGVQVSVPAVAGRTFEVVPLWRESFPKGGHTVAVSAFAAWPKMRESLARDGPLAESTREVLILTAAGNTAAQVAEIMNMSESGVRHHLKMANAGLDARNGYGAVQRAQLRGILP